MSDVFSTIEESLKIHSRITIYYQGREIGVILSPRAVKMSINNDHKPITTFEFISTLEEKK